MRPPIPWLHTLLIVWVLVLGQLNTQALAESLHHHQNDNLCQQHELLKQLTSLLPTPQLVNDLVAIMPVHSSWVIATAVRQQGHTPNNRGPPLQ